MATIQLSTIPPIPSPGDKDFETKIGRVLSHMPTLASELKTIAETVVESAVLVDVEGNATVAATAAAQAAVSAASSTAAATTAQGHANTAKAEATKAARSKADAAVSASQAGISAQAAALAKAAAEAAVTEAETIATTTAESVAEAAAAAAAQEAVSGVIAEAQTAATAASASATAAASSATSAGASATSAQQQAQASGASASTASAASIAAAGHAQTASTHAANALASKQQAEAAAVQASEGAATVTEILDNLTTGPVVSVNGKYGAVNLGKADVGLGKVDNTTDLEKPISTATQAALNGKEASGTAAAAMTAHTNAEDPHSQYLLKTGGTASSLTLADGYTEEVFDVTGTTPALSPTNGSIQTWALTGNATPTLRTWGSGQSMTLLIDDGTAYSINWASTGIVWKTGGGTAPVLLTTGYTALALVNVGGTVYGWLAGDA